MNKSEKQYNEWYEKNYPKIGLKYNLGNKVPYKNLPEQVNFKLSVLEYEKLEASRKKMGLSKSEYLRKLINENYED